MVTTQPVGCRTVVGVRVIEREREREQKVFVHCRLRHLFAPLWLQDAKWHKWIHTKILASASAPALAMKGWEGWKATS